MTSSCLRVAQVVSIGAAVFASGCREPVTTPGEARYVADSELASFARDHGLKSTDYDYVSVDADDDGWSVCYRSTQKKPPYVVVIVPKRGLPEISLPSHL